MTDLHDTMRREPDWPAAPHLIPLALRWHLLTNPAVMMGSFFFGLGIIFAMALGTNTGVLGTLRLAWDRAEIPGWLDQVTETQYEENEQRVYQYAYHFRLPDGTQHTGKSYLPGQVLRQPAAGANPARPPDVTWDQLDFFYKHGLGYAQEMANRPQTLYGIADSPVGLAAWMLDHDARSQALMARVFDGKPEGLTRDDILDNVTLYWLTNTAVSSARLYWESKLAFFAPKGVPIPAAVSVFPDEIYAAPKSWTEKAYPKLIHYNRLPKGCHFAAWEQPELFVAELRAGFKSLR